MGEGMARGTGDGSRAETMSGVYLQTVVQGQRREFPLEELAVCRIGRAEQSTIVLSGDVKVSRNHAVVQRMDNGEYFLTDLGSRNGTILNGRMVAGPTALHNGDSHPHGRLRVRIRAGKGLDAGRAAPDAGGGEDHDCGVDAADDRAGGGHPQFHRSDDGAGRVEDVGDDGLGVPCGRGWCWTRNGSYAQKYIGDAVMAVWVHEGDRPVQRDLLCDFPRAVRAGGHHRRIAGPVRAARAGVFRRRGSTAAWRRWATWAAPGLADHTAMGECVNKAFRLETASKELGVDVVVGRDTYGFLDTVPDIREILEPATANLKGYVWPEAVHVASLERIRRGAGEDLTIS